MSKKAKRLKQKQMEGPLYEAGTQMDTPTGNERLFTGADTAIGAHFRNELGQFLSGNPGTTKRYNNTKDLQEAIIKYFEFCETNKKHLTMTGLAIALGFRSRSSLVNYEKEDGYEFAYDVIQYAKMRIEEYTEQRLHDQRTNIVGAIFSLKNNWGWADKQEIKMDSRTLQFNGFEIEGLNDGKTINITEDKADA